MTKSKNRWNTPSWPWELELITLLFFLIALLVPMYYSNGASPGIAPTDVPGGQPGQLSTQFGFLWAVAIIAVYVMHLAISFIEMDRVTASPVHLLSPCVFAVLAYYRIDQIPELQQTAFSAIDGSLTQVIVLVLAVGVVTSLFARLRKFRYMLNFSDVQWDIISPAVYDKTYFTLMMSLRPVLYAPRQYRACNAGILIEGWFYAYPIAFSDIRAMAALKSTSTSANGLYYASSAQHLVRLELHDSLKPTFISPADREEFVRYCLQRFARRKNKNRASTTHHDISHAAGTRADDTKASGTRHS